MWGVVINPISGRGVGAQFGLRVTDFLSNNGVSYRIISGASAENTREALRLFLSTETCEGVIAVGGDGLVHLVLQQVAGTKVPMAVVPAGTGNDFYRTLGWPLDNLEKVLSAVLYSRPTPVDLGIVDGEWFGAILSTGFDSLVNERANKMIWPKGPMKYNVAILLELLGFTPRKYELSLDGVKITTQAMLIAVGNGSSYGGGMKACPGADIRDGLFDVMVLSPISKFKFLRVFPRVYSGTHVTHPAVRIYRGREISIDSDAVAYADGERVGPLPVKAECVSGALLTWCE
ncbi:MAG: diacylglycerol kinase family protein [Actinobacteria bacterium]|nr:diacylglycerol kinase family protein [Actinomycetota bacterium]